MLMYTLNQSLLHALSITISLEIMSFFTIHTKTIVKQACRVSDVHQVYKFCDVGEGNTT